jgi:hypothetical protein
VTETPIHVSLLSTDAAGRWLLVPDPDSDTGWAFPGRHFYSSSDESLKRLLVRDPLRKLQLLLGHRQIATTFAYLDVLDEAQEIVLAALREWGEEAEALSRIEGKETTA